VVLIVIALEFGLLIAKAQWNPLDAMFRLLPGTLMLIALRGALTGCDWPWIALPLILSFPAHLADLARSPKRPGDPN